VFDEAKGEPQMRYSPKEEDDGPSDALTIDESTSAPLNADELEDLEAPIPKPVAVKKDTLSDDEVVILE